MRRASIVASGVLLCVLAAGGTFLPLSALGAEKDDEWRVPSRYVRRENPEPADPDSLRLGERVYEKECASCHGDTGEGDGPEAADLEVPVGSLRTADAWQDTEGALFYKITRGRRPMPGYRKKLSKEERWHVINYIRTLAPPIEPLEPRFALPDGPARALWMIVERTLEAEAQDEPAPRETLQEVLAHADPGGDAGMKASARAEWGGTLDLLGAALGGGEAIAPVLAKAVRTFGLPAADRRVFFFECPHGNGSWLQLEAEPDARRCEQCREPRYRLGPR